MGFNVKKIIRLALDKGGGKEHRHRKTHSPIEDGFETPSSQSSTHNQDLASKTNKAPDHHCQTDVTLQEKGFRHAAFKKLRSVDTKDSGGQLPSSGDPKLEQLFDELRDAAEDGKDTLGVGSTLKYLTSLGLDPESGEIFVALELVQAPHFGEITRESFVKGWKETGCPPRTSDQAKYISALVGRLSKDPSYFKRVYRYTFIAGKESGQRSLSLENAIAFWRVLFSPPGRPWKTPTHDWLSLWVEFLQEKWTRSVNRDMWNQTLEFATKCMNTSSLSFWNEDGAWPSVIDDFVAWFHARESGTKDAMQTDS